MNVHAKLTLPETTPLAVVQAYFAAFGAGDLDGVLALLADNVVWHVDGSVTVPTIGLLRGRERVHRWLSEFPNGFTPRVFAIDRLFESGDDVMALGRFRHLARATGRVVGSDLAIRFTVRDGRIERYQIMEDSLLLARAFDPYDAWGEHEVRLNGTTYAHSDRGDGPVVLFAHGLFVDRTIFDPQVTTLEATHRCIVLDMPGHGRSGWRKEGWTLEDVAEDMALFIEEAALGPVSFIGQSQGGMIGMRLAARRPDLVSSLVLIGTSARAEDPERLPRWHEVRRTLAEGALEEREALFADMQALLNDPNWLASEPALAASERAIMLEHEPVALALAVDAAVLSRQDVRSLLPSVRAPTLVTCGESDRATSPELSRELASLIPTAHLAVLPGVGHHPPLEAPAAVDALLQDFLA
jgi:3-oxoadipate enol-lactonase